MALQLNRLHLIRNILQLHRNASTALFKSPESEYTSTPQYPEILDLSPEAKLERKKQEWYDTIKAVKTVEEKQIKLNMPRYYGFKCYLLKEDHIPYNNLPLTQHVTRTHIIKTNKLPEFYDKIDVNIEGLQGDIEECIQMELDGYKRIHDLKEENLEKEQLENLIGSSITKSINRILINHLSRQFDHLGDAQVDFDTRIESFWYAGGMDPPLNIVRRRKACSWMTEDQINEATNRAMTYLGSSTISLRSDKPLKPILPKYESENLEVPYWKYDPRTVGISTEYRHIANVPGFWPGDSHEFGLLSFHKRGHHSVRDFNDKTDSEEALIRQGILASFGWLNAQANFQGFTTYNDITYPLVTQTVITNGQLWSFYIYQLNTILVHSKHIKENPKTNVCWATPETKLFDEIKDGKLINFNPEILKTLAKLYANTPELKLGVNLKPYLSNEEKVIADYAHDEKRQWLETEYKDIVSNRPRHFLDEEIYHWEKIYKIDNETRFMDARHRFFALKIDPYRRTLDDRKPRYIPKALRPHLPKYKGRRATEYWP